MADLGYSSLFSGFVIYLLSFILLIYGIYKKNKRILEGGKRGIIIGSIFTILSSISLWYLLLTKNFQVEYVANYVSGSLSLIYTFSSFWAGMEGSMLFWGLILVIYVLIYINTRKKEGEREYISYAVLAFISVFFLFITTFLTNPFKLLPFTPEDGRGLNPLLHNFWMLIHPVAIYLGYVGFSIPFAYSVSVLIKGEEKGWTNSIRKWTLIPWIFLTIGIVFGGRWAYIELGWGGYWAWDPVENASFLPWLTATAFLHTLLLQETKNVLKTWNMILIALTFLLTILGTYITRSGILSSVHAFAESEISPYFLIFMILTSLLFTFVLIKFNNNIKSEKEKFNFLSVEGLILFLLFALVAITIIVIIGTFYPIISEAITAQKKTVGHPFFNKTTGPFFITIILLLGFLPFINLKNSSKIILVLSLLAGTVTIIFVYFKIQTHPGAWASYGVSVFALLSVIYHFYKGIKKYANQYSKSVFITLIKSPILLPRKFGVFITHLGVVLTAVGIVSSYGFQKKQEFKVKKTESVKFNGYEITHNGLFEKRTPLFDEVEAHLLFKSNNGKTRELKPKIRFYHYWEQPSTEMDVMPLLTGDIYAIIQGWEKDETLYFQVFYNPLIQLVWIGSFLIFLGPIIILTIRREKQ